MPTAVAYQDRKEEAVQTGRCIRGGCAEPPTPDSFLCAPHLERERDYKRRWIAKRRRKRRRERKCEDCAAPLKPSERIWCTAHRLERNRLKALRQPGVESGVEKSERVAAHTRTHADGRTRYHGQGKRGQQPKAQLLAQDARLARERFEAFAAGVTLLDSDEAKTWTRGERERVEKAIASCGKNAVRHLDGALERIGHFKERHGRRDGEE